MDRRKFLAIAAAAPLLQTCTLPEIKTTPLASESLEDIIRNGVGLLRKGEYAEARGYLRAYRGGYYIDNSARTQGDPSIDFLYAMSNVPDGTIFDGIPTAGSVLTDVLRHVQDNPKHLHHLQEKLTEFFTLPEYPSYKAMFTEKLKGRYQMLAFLICLVEKDYQTAKQALVNSHKHLTLEEQNKLTLALSLLSEEAERIKDDERIAVYKVLRRSIR